MSTSCREEILGREPRLTIFERSRPGRGAASTPAVDVPDRPLDELVPAALRRTRPARLPEVAEVDIVRHFTNLSALNYGVDNGAYPLGSCTMKYNPRVNERAAALEGFRGLHPYQPESLAQGALELLHTLEGWLCEVAGLARATLQPAAGAHGELTGLLLMRAAHEARGRAPRRIVIPDTAHGTNPASVIMAGYDPVPVSSDTRGGVDMDRLREIVAEGDIAGLMLTNPSTLGLFEEHILEIAELVHGAGGLLYYDGANSNAVLGISRPGDMGFDIVHFNTHKTFSTPHGGGGPGAGPIVVGEELVPFLPVPTVEKREDGTYYLDHDRPRSIGKVRTFYGNVGVLVRAYAYIRALGPDGLRRVSERAVLNANYVLAGLRDLFDVPFERRCMHEFVVSATPLREHGVRAMDVAKRLLDHGVHPPTTYFPLIVDEALMVEPTETESRESLDRIVEAFRTVAREAAEDPEMVGGAPHTLPVRRLDEASAARKPVVRQRFPEDEGAAAS
ncbi:MAG: aminomethyl-transferring glycine dehydrogenase subunit GcvPB [Thermoleophilia bacterium]|jgi:glycine dehydrogenase subunit 2|nr:aminomethyl-transferring glycine dehydrogenase subunit GcvPB [Thermoleophilia bacterium]